MLAAVVVQHLRMVRLARELMIGQGFAFVDAL